jgi:hypothetical protein
MAKQSKKPDSKGGATLKAAPEKGKASRAADAYADTAVARGDETIDTGPGVLKVSLSVAGGLATAYAAGQGATNYINDLIAITNKLNSKSYLKCQQEKLIQDESGDPEDQSWGGQCKSCAKKHTLIAAFLPDEDNPEDGAKQEVDFSTILEFLSAMSQPADIAGCVNPYWQKFFSLIPYQLLLSHFIKMIIESALKSRIELNEEIDKLVEESACGTEIKEVIKRSKTIKPFDYPDFDIYKLPPIPRLAIPNLFQILNKVILDLACWGLCCSLTPLLKNLTEAMLDLTDRLIESEGGSEDIQGSLSSSQLEKVNLNDWISDEAILAAINAKKLSQTEYSTVTAAGTKKYVGLNKALIEILPPKPKDVELYTYQMGVWREPTATETQEASKKIIEITRGFFKNINDWTGNYKKKTLIVGSKPPEFELKDATRELGTGEIIYLMMGNANCLVIGDVLAVAKGETEFVEYLNLTDADKILEFFQFLYTYVNVFDVVESAKPKDCPVDPCVEMDNEQKDKILGALDGICGIMNPAMGLPPVPIDAISSRLGLTDLMAQGVKGQFGLLKKKYFEFLGNPPFWGPGMPKVPGGPVMAMPPPIKNANSFQMHFAIYNYLWPVLSKQLEMFEPSNKNNPDARDAKFDAIYGDFINKVMWRGGGGIPAWPYDNIDFASKFQGATLADECTEETFVETFSLALKKEFRFSDWRHYMKDGQKYISLIEKNLPIIEQNLITERFARPLDPAKIEEFTGKMNNCCAEDKDGSACKKNLNSPCCGDSFKGYTFKVHKFDYLSTYGLDDMAVPGPGASPGEKLENKMYNMYNEMHGSDDEADLNAIAKKLSKEERCYICKRPTFSKQKSEPWPYGWDQKYKWVNHRSLLYWLETDLDFESDRRKFQKSINCEEFGITTWKGADNAACCNGVLPSEKPTLYEVSKNKCVDYAGKDASKCLEGKK